MKTPLSFRLASFALAAIAGTSAALADGVVAGDNAAKADVGTPYGTAVSTFRPDRPQITDEQIVAAKRAGQELILDRVLERAPLAQGGAMPNYFYVRGRQVPMHLRTTQIGIRVAEGVAEGAEQTEADQARWTERAVAAAKAAGLKPAVDGHLAINGWVRVALVEALKDHADAFNRIEALIKTPGVLAGAPVFENAFIEGGYYMPTEQVLVGTDPAVLAASVASAHSAGFEVANASLGRMPGAMALRSTERNGYTVLSRANGLFEKLGYSWVSPAAYQTLELHVTTPNDPNFLNLQWCHRNTGQDFVGGGITYNGVAGRDMDTDQAWDITTGRSTIRVLVLDVGIETSHPDLNFFSGRNFTTGAVAGVGDGSPGNSCDNHGTSVAGCAANIINNNLEEAGTAGGCSVMSARIGVSETGPCSSTFSSYSNAWLVNAIDWGRDNGAKVTNASIGVGQDDAVEAMYTSTWNSGLLHFASAGNGGSDSIGDNGSGFPGSAPFTISVSALDPDGTLTSFSNYGTNCDLCSGGRFILVGDRIGSAGYTTGNNVYFSGTSAASPLAAGVGLLFFSQFGFATPSQARTAIFNSCDDLGAAGIDTSYNRGFINAYGALKENAPANDDCTTPNIINANGGTVVYHWIMDTTWATPSRLEPDESCSGSVNNTVFFRFTADHTGTVTIHTAGSGYDTVLSAYSGCPTFNAAGTLTGSPTQIACNDDFNGTFQSSATFDVTYGQTILIKASKFGSTAGGGTLDFNFRFDPVAPANDACSTAEVITDPETGTFSFNPPNYDVTFANSSALCALDENCGSSNGSSNAVFYRFVPKHDGLIQMNTFGSSYDTVMSLFSNCSTFNLSTGCSRTTEYACSDDANGGLQSSIGPFAVNGGSSYIIKVARYGTTANSSLLALNFNFQYTPLVPVNDTCANATVIPGTGIPGGFTQYNPAPYDIYFATESQCEPTPTCSGILADTRSVWYTFTPSLSGAINISTAGSDYDTVLTIHASCAVPFVNNTCRGGAQLACSDNNSPSLTSQILNFHVDAGQDYLIRVASKLSPASGTGTLDFNFQYAAVACPADFNGDGSLDPDDLSDFIGAFFSQPPSQSADYNGDGTVDPDDLSDYITAFFAGC